MFTEGLVRESLVRDGLGGRRKKQLDSAFSMEWRHHKSIGKKLRYMSKFAAIFSVSDNTQLMCTQPIRNLLMASA
jgi:hypothetical protein